MNNIILISPTGNKDSLLIYKEKPNHKFEEVLKVRKKVYEDIKYKIEIDEDINNKNVDLYVNGEYIDVFIDGRYLIPSSEKAFLFLNIYGFAQISLRVADDKSVSWYYTELLSVLVKPSRKNKSISSMMKYIYENQDDCLYRDVSISSLGNDETSHDFWSQLILLEEIANTYEDNYGYFMANSRYKLEKVERLDRIEKLQYCDGKTIQYIVQHPEHLKRNAIGINYGTQIYLPSKTLMVQNVISYDIYENKVVIGFLQRMVNDIRELKKSWLNITEGFNISENSEDGYLVSAFLIFKNAEEQVDEFKNKLDVLEDKFYRLFLAYENILDIEPISFLNDIRPTSVFLNVQQYNRIYYCILRWINRKSYRFEKEKIMMNFFNAPEVFEMYNLVKLISEIKNVGYELIESKHVEYPLKQEWKYVSKECNNTFVFNQEEKIITLYYEPIIYDKDYSSLNGIDLYRNNTISMSMETEEEYYGHYYVPDFIIKYSVGGRNEYIIGDAKYSHYTKVKSKEIPKLAYKYLTSISTINDTSRIKGLYVFYGITDNHEESESFYNISIPGAKEINPEIRIVPVSEEISYNVQGYNFLELLRRLYK